MPRNIWKYPEDADIRFRFQISVNKYSFARQKRINGKEMTGREIFFKALRMDGW